jgi:hypothetical protein
VRPRGRHGRADPSRGYPASDYYADGCGKRAVYRCNPASLTQTCAMLLVAKFDK